jgi:hypothetical protein
MPRRQCQVFLTVNAGFFPEFPIPGLTVIRQPRTAGEFLPGGGFRNSDLEQGT